MSTEHDRTLDIHANTEMVESVFERMRFTGTFSVMHDEDNWRLNFEPHPAAGLPQMIYAAEAHWLWNAAAEIDRQVRADRGDWPARLNPGNDFDPRFE